MALFATRSRKSSLVKLVLASAFFTVLTLLRTYPLIRHFDTQLPGGRGDPQLVTWILAWGVHALTTDPLNLFNANIFYPVQNTLALSEHMIAVSPIFASVYLPTGNPIMAYNVVFFLSFILCGTAMYLLVHRWTGNFWASLVSGFLFAFGPIRFAEIYHLQLCNFYWAPLVLLFLDEFLISNRWKALLCFAIFYWLQMLASVYLGWLMTISVGVYICVNIPNLSRALLSRSMILQYISFVIASLIIIVPFHIPYHTLQQQWGFSSSLQECIDLSVDPLMNYLSPSHLVNDIYLSLIRNYYPRLLYAHRDQRFFPGLVLSFLVVMGSLPVAKCLLAGRARQLRRSFGIILIVALLLSLGPYLVILGRNTGIPLPYLLFYYLVPGFQAMRVPARFALLAVLAASVLAAPGFLRVSHFLQRRWSHKRVWTHGLQGVLALCFIGLANIELGFKPLPSVSLPIGHHIPAVYQWLATKPLGGPIIEFPLGQSFWEALEYMYFSTFHWRPLVNGASRFLPRTHAQLSSALRDFPTRKGAELLGALGVRSVVVHTDRLDPPSAARWRSTNLADIGLREVARFGVDVVYEMAPVPASHQLQVEIAVPDHLPTGEIVQSPRKAPLTLQLLANSAGQSLWVHPSPLGRIPAVIEWREQVTGARRILQQHVELPLALSAEERWSTSLPTHTPAVSGQYTVAVRMPSLGLQTTPKRMQITPSQTPQSATSPRSLAAAYILEAPLSQVVTIEDFDVTLRAINTGRAVWPATARDDRGEVRLGWRWFKGTATTPLKEEGRSDLAYDVFPGQAYRFETRIKIPAEPGDYTLELGLVSELVTWFSDNGVTPLKIPILVPRP
jgi:hypothetical protein